MIEANEFPYLLEVVESRTTIRGTELLQRTTIRGTELLQRSNIRLEAELERLGKPKGPVPPRRFLAMLPSGR